MSPYFFVAQNVENIVLTGPVISGLAVGLFMVIVTAGIDLSVGAVCNTFDLRGVATEPQLIMKGRLILPAVYLTSGHGAEVYQRNRQSMAARRTC